MICARCGTDNVEGAVFCKKCGRRLDGNAICPHCGNLTPGDGEFCIHCGSNRNAPIDENLKYQKESEASLVKNTKPFTPTPSVGTSVIATNKKTTKNVNQVNKSVGLKSSKLTFAFRLTSFISSCLVIFFSTLFTFLVGVIPTLSTSGESASTGEGVNLYYFFSDALDVLGTANGSEFYLPGIIFGIIVVIAGLIGIAITLGFSIKAIVTWVKNKETSITKYAVISYFVFIGLVSLFMLITCTSIDTSGISVKYSLNGATIAGIILGAIFLLASVVFDTLLKKNTISLKSFLTSSISTSLIMIIGLVTISSLGMGYLSVTQESVGISSTTSMGLYGISSMLGQTGVNLYETSDEVWNEFIGNYLGSTILMGLSLAFAIYGVYSFIVYLRNTLTNFGDKFNKSTLINGINFGACMTLIGVLIFINDYVFGNYFFNVDGENSKYNLTVPIMLLIFGILIIVGAIVSYIFNKEDKKEIEVSEEPELE